MAKQQTAPDAKPETKQEPLKVTIDGTTYTPAMLNLAEIGQLRIWAKKHQPDPMAAIKPYLDSVDESAQRIMIDHALTLISRPVAFGSLEFNSAIQTGEGLREVLWLSLKRGGVDVTRESSDAIADAMNLDQAGDVFTAAFGDK